jgi:hypothetical protein
MVETPLKRRGVLRLGAAASLALAGFGLGGCAGPSPRLLGSRGDLPSTWSSRLPKPWQVLLLDEAADVRQALSGGPGASGDPRAALVQLGDGWAADLPKDALQAIGTPELLARLDPLAKPVAQLFDPTQSTALAFPWSINPWVLVFRNRPDLARRKAEGWDLLLDPSLRGRVLLPASPRVCIALVEGHPARLAGLRAQALAYDDRDGLSLLLDGRAEAAVLPRQRVIPLLRRDPRLAVVLPEQGGPVAWNLLLSPAGAPAAPLEWLGEALEPPLLVRLLTAGWVPPLPAAQLERALAGFPEGLRALLAPPSLVQARWHNLPPLSGPERSHLQALWDGAAPPQPKS